MSNGPLFAANAANVIPCTIYYLLYHDDRLSLAANNQSTGVPVFLSVANKHIAHFVFICVVPSNKHTNDTHTTTAHTRIQNAQLASFFFASPIQHTICIIFRTLRYDLIMYFGQLRADECTMSAQIYSHYVWFRHSWANINLDHNFCDITIRRCLGFYDCF